MARDGWGERRAQREWQRALEAEIRALPTSDTDTPDGGEVEPLPDDVVRYEPRRAPLRAPRSGGTRHAPDHAVRDRSGRPRGERRRTLTTLAVTVVVIAAMAVVSFGPGAQAVRGLLGLGNAGRLADAVTAPGEGSYAFLDTQDGSADPVAWSPCREIHYEVNPEQAPDDWQTILTDAIDEVSRATGLVFVFDGLTDSRAFDNRFDGERPLPVLIGWAGSDEVLGLEGDVAGLAGPASTRFARQRTYVSGKVVIDANAFDDLGTEQADVAERTVLMHELGHLVGLDHVDDARELMYAETTGRTSFNTGDLEGLAALGDGRC